MEKILNKYHEDGLLYKQVHPTLPLVIWNYTEKVQYEKLWDEITLMCIRCPRLHCTSHTQFLVYYSKITQ